VISMQAKSKLRAGEGSTPAIVKMQCPQALAIHHTRSRLEHLNRGGGGAVEMCARGCTCSCPRVELFRSASPDPPRSAGGRVTRRQHDHELSFFLQIEGHKSRGVENHVYGMSFWQLLLLKPKKCTTALRMLCVWSSCINYMALLFCPFSVRMITIFLVVRTCMAPTA
jgi:hypothetical protein